MEWNKLIDWFFFLTENLIRGSLDTQDDDEDMRAWLERPNKSIKFAGEDNEDDEVDDDKIVCKPTHMHMLIVVIFSLLNSRMQIYCDFCFVFYFEWVVLWCL